MVYIRITIRQIINILISATLLNLLIILPILLQMRSY